MEGWILLGLIFVGLFIAAPMMALTALARTRALRGEVSQLRHELELVRRRSSESPASGAPAPVVMAERARPPEAVVAPEPMPRPVREEPAARATPEPAPEAPVASASDWAKTSASIERMIAANWLVWVGGAALALGGIFLVRFAWEQGYFGPLARTIAATIAGIVMIAASEWLRRRIPADATGEIRRAPMVVAAAGAVTLYGAAYAAGPLYHLVSPELTLAGFVLASAVAVGLAVVHGVLLAALGLTGGYVAPLLVGGGAPDSVVLLSYAFAVTLACLVLVRAFNWERIVWVALCGAGMWMLIGIGMTGLANAPLAVAGYGLGLIIAATAFAWSDADVVLLRHKGEPAPGTPNQTLVMAIGFWAVAGAGLLMAMIATGWGRQDPLMIALALYGAAAIFAGWRKPAFEAVPVFGMAAFLVCLGVAPVDPPVFVDRFVMFAWAGAAASGLGGWAAMRTLRHQTLMAVVSAFTPLGLLLIVFQRLGFDQHLSWGLLGGLLAMLNLLALEGIRRSRVGLDSAAGAASAYALAAFASSMFAVGASLGDMWMTVVFAAHLPAIAMIDRRFNLQTLRFCASIAAMVVVGRLLWPQEILSYQVSPVPVLNELTLLYALSIACFWGAARLFAANLKSSAAPLVQALDVGALTLFTVLAGLTVRHAVTGGDLAAGNVDLVEMSAYTIAFASLAIGLDARRGAQTSAGLGVAIGVVYVLAATLAVMGLGLIANPLLSALGQRYVLDGPPLLNLLASSYLPPAALFGVHAALSRRKGRSFAGHLSGFIALALVFVYLTLEVRNAFHVELSLRFNPIGEAESYSYSIAWLLFAVVILIVGMARRQVAIRHAAMGVLAVSVAKVFLMDMASLTGVWRAASFMGLGVALIAIAYLYQRVVFRREAS